MVHWQHRLLKIRRDSNTANSYPSLHYPQVGGTGPFAARGDYVQALKRYRKAVALQEKLGDQAVPAKAYNNIGLIYKAWGDYDQALGWYRKSVAITEKLGDQAGLAGSYNNIALVHLARGESEAAVALFERNLATLERLGAQADADTVRANLEQAKRLAQKGRPA
jgi:tetratricopeptide (TPR) repeat protein